MKKSNQSITKLSKAQYNLYGQTPNTLALSSENVDKYEFLTGKDALPEKRLAKKAATIKIFEYLLLGSEMKKQNEIARKQYQGLDKVYEFDRSNYSKNLAKIANLNYDSRFNSNKYRNNKKLKVFLLLQNSII